MTHAHDIDAEEHLHRALRALPSGVEPGRDLWPGIESQLGRRGRERAAVARNRRWAWQAAAAVLLVVASSVLTATLIKRGGVPQATTTSAAQRGMRAMPAAFGPDHTLSPEYDAARRQLMATLQRRMALMPPAARRKLESNLAEMQRAAAEINAALDRQPGDPLLEELLLDTYQDQLAVLTAVNQLTSTGATRPRADPTRMQL